MRAPPAGRPTQKLAGDRPKHRRAPTPRTGQAAVVLFNFERVFCVCIAFEGDLSEVAYAVGGTSLAGLDFLRYVHVVSEIPVAPPREGARKTCVTRGGLLLTSCCACPCAACPWSCVDPVFPWTPFRPGRYAVGVAPAQLLISLQILPKGEGRSPTWTSGESVCATVQCAVDRLRAERLQPALVRPAAYGE